MKLIKERTGKSPWRQSLALVGTSILSFWIILAMFAPWIAPYDPLAQDVTILNAPSAAHWFGTDEVGRDVLSRIIYGARISLPLSIMLVILSIIVGSIVGGIAGYFGGWFDSVLMRMADMVLAFPGIILAMAVAAALGPQLRNAVLAIVVVSWPTYARLVRSMIRSAKDSEYIKASRLLGSSSFRTLMIDLRPNISGPVLVLGALEAGNALLLLSGLSFLGLGAQPPASEWGAMVSSGATNFDKWWVGVFPGAAIMTAVMAFNFIGDTLRDALDPRTARALRN
jgi:ABC-type dipeptide/oligopeptide/nickel transport system permease subunit